MNAPAHPTRWPHLVAYFFGALFFANFFPHFVTGVAGSPFQSPFAHPPGVGLSSSVSNVGWALFNLGVAYVLLGRVGRFDHRAWAHFVPAASGFALGSLWLAHNFSRLHGGRV